MLAVPVVCRYFWLFIAIVRHFPRHFLRRSARRRLHFAGITRPVGSGVALSNRHGAITGASPVRFPGGSRDFLRAISRGRTTKSDEKPRR